MMPPSNPSRPHRDEQGFILLAVTVLTFAMVIGSLAIFHTAGSETKLAHREADATRAFFLADGALERARARLADSRSWRDGWQNVPLAGGTYSLSIADTTIPGRDNTVKLTATGTVGDVTRQLEVVGELPPSGLGLAVLTQSWATFLGNVCITGKAHHNTWAFYGFRNRFLRCGSYTKGYTINPPPIYTDPDHFPNCTYYDVRVVFAGGHNADVRIFDADGHDITTALGDSLVGLAHRLHGHEYVIGFPNSKLRHYFDQETGVFRRASGDSSVVINFGGEALRPHPHGWQVDPQSTTSVSLNMDDVWPIHSTIITMRFTGQTELDRLRRQAWRGGLLVLDGCRMEPYNGIATIAKSLLTHGLCVIGSEEWPALAYSVTTGTLLRFECHGSLISLGNQISILGPINLHYSSRLLDHLPAYLVTGWPGHTSGTLRVLSWRELPTTSTGG